MGRSLYVFGGHMKGDMQFKCERSIDVENLSSTGQFELLTIEMPRRTYLSHIILSMAVP